VAAHTIIVPDGADKNLDVGELAVKLNPQLCKGQAVPLFDVETVDGKRIRLQDLRGKVVLLAFWASWCGECVADIPLHKDLYAAFGSNERFAMLGLSLDRSAETVRDFTESHGMEWPQGILGDWSQTKVPSQYAVPFIPRMYLIDQNGILIDTVRGPRTREAIEKALADLN
jgi:peroxiredoxin